MWRTSGRGLIAGCSAAACGRRDASSPQSWDPSVAELHRAGSHKLKDREPYRWFIGAFHGCVQPELGHLPCFWGLMCRRCRGCGCSRTPSSSGRTDTGNNDGAQRRQPLHGAGRMYREPAARTEQPPNRAGATGPRQKSVQEEIKQHKGEGSLWK